MICSKCGFDSPEGSRFCASCGAPLVVMPAQVVNQAFPGEEASPDYRIDNPMAPEGQAGQGQYAAAPPKPNAKRTKVIIGVAVAAVIVAAGIGGGLWWKVDQDAKAAAAEKAAWEYAHAPQTVSISVEAPEFDESSTGIPVHITGTDADGAGVDVVQYLKCGAEQVNVVQGSYDFEFSGGYFTSAGHIGKAPGTIQHVDVKIEGDKGSSSVSVTELEKVTYSIVADLEVTDDLIKDVSTWASHDADNAAQAEKLKGEVVSKRDAAVAEKKRQEEEEAARKAAEEEAARRAAEEEAARARAAAASGEAFAANSNPKSVHVYDMGDPILTDIKLVADSNGNPVLKGTLRNDSKRAPVRLYWFLFGCHYTADSGEDLDLNFETNGGELTNTYLAPGSSMTIEMRYHKRHDNEPVAVDPNRIVYYEFHGNRIE